MLKAALAGVGKGAKPPPAPERAVDAASFPCIDETAELDSTSKADDLAQDIDQRLRLHRQSSLAGSMPSARGYRNSVRS